MSLNLPKSTEINRFVAKTNFYKRTGITPKLRDLIESQIDRITWENKVSPTTINISSGVITEFQVFGIQIKTPELNDAILFFMQKSVPYPIIFIIRGARDSKIIAVIRSAKRPIILSTEWKTGLSVEIKGKSTDAIYKNFLLQLFPIFASAGGDVEKYEKTVKLKRNIDALCVKIKNEIQISKRQLLAREKHELEQELEELIK